MRQVAHVLLTRPPLASSPKRINSLDLHVLGTPPAFVLSQDQTLTKKFNHLLKLLWVFVLRLSKELLVYFNYILFNFQRPFTLSHQSDLFILSSITLSVNNFFKSFNLFRNRQWLSYHFKSFLSTTYFLSYLDTLSSATFFILSLLNIYVNLFLCF